MSCSWSLVTRAGHGWRSGDSRWAGEQNPRPLFHESGGSGEKVRGAIQHADLEAAPTFDAPELNDIGGGRVCPGPGACLSAIAPMGPGASPASLSTAAAVGGRPLVQKP